MESAPKKLKNSLPNRSKINKNLILGRKWSLYKLHWLTLGSILVAVAALLAPFGWFWSTLSSTLLALGALLAQFRCHWTYFWLHYAALGAILHPLGARLTPFGCLWIVLLAPLLYFNHPAMMFCWFCILSAAIYLLLKGSGLGGEGGGMHNFHTHLFQHYIPSASTSLTGTVRNLLCNLDISKIDFSVSCFRAEASLEPTWAPFSAENAPRT